MIHSFAFNVNINTSLITTKESENTIRLYFLKSLLYLDYLSLNKTNKR